MCDFNPHSLGFDGLTPDDPFAPRRYPRDLFADCDTVPLQSDDPVGYDVPTLKRNGAYEHDD